MKYVVSVTRKNSAKITVEAKDRDEAIDKASELAEVICVLGILALLNSIR